MVSLNPIFSQPQPDDFDSEERQSREASPFGWRIHFRSPTWRPPTDVFETEDALVVRVEIAGMRNDDFQVELDDRLLTVHGARADLSERRAYHQMEIRFGEFQIEVELPTQVVANQVEAIYKNGFLRIALPKARTHQIQIDQE